MKQPPVSRLSLHEVRFIDKKPFFRDWRGMDAVLAELKNPLSEIKHNALKRRSRK